MSDCSVCLSSLEEDRFTLPCAHAFHRACLVSCVRYHFVKCPLCQRTLPVDIRRELCPEYREPHRLTPILTALLQAAVRLPSPRVVRLSGIGRGEYTAYVYDMERPFMRSEY